MSARLSDETIERYARIIVAVHGRVQKPRGLLICHTQNGV